VAVLRVAEEVVAAEPTLLLSVPRLPICCVTWRRMATGVWFPAVAMLPAMFAQGGELLAR